VDQSRAVVKQLFTVADTCLTLPLWPVSVRWNAG